MPLRWREYSTAVEQITASPLPATSAAASPAPTRPIIPTARCGATRRPIRHSGTVGVVEAVGYTVAVGVGVVRIETHSRLLAVGQAISIRIRTPSIAAATAVCSPCTRGLFRVSLHRSFRGRRAFGHDLPERILTAVGRVGIDVGVVYLGSGRIRTPCTVRLGDLGSVRDRLLVVSPAEEYASKDPGEDEQRE